MAGVVAVLCFALLAGAAAAEKPVIKKLGTIECDLVETSPVVFRDKLYRFEYVRERYKPNTTGDSYFRFVDVASGRATPSFAAGYHLGSAHVEGNTVYVYGIKDWGAGIVKVFWSGDLKTWQSASALDLPGRGIFNTSVCKGRRGYVMAIELGEPPGEVGVRFTMRFAESDDLKTWRLLPADCIYSKDRYTACPEMKFLDDWYYMVYLEQYPGPSYLPHIVRTRDFVAWENSPLNPVLRFSDEDRRIANPRLTEGERQRIAGAVNINNSDVALCDHRGRTVIYYSWGDQQGMEHLAEAVYEGGMAQFLKAWFP
jgi:hypothetical protein